MLAQGLLSPRVEKRTAKQKIHTALLSDAVVPVLWTLCTTMIGIFCVHKVLSQRCIRSRQLGLLCGRNCAQLIVGHMAGVPPLVSNGYL